MLTVIDCFGMTDIGKKRPMEQEISSVVETKASAEAICQDFVEAANAAGGSDHITVVLACLGTTDRSSKGYRG